MRHAAITLLLLCAFAQSAVPREAKPHYVFVMTPSALPADVQRGLADYFHESKLLLAAPNERFNDSCLDVESMPRHRMLIAAISKQVAVVHFQSGGFAPSSELVMLARDGRDARVFLSRQMDREIRDPRELDKLLAH